MDAPLIVAALLLLVGLPWLVYLGYRRGGVIWALLILFFSHIAGFVFCVVKKEGWVPWLLVLAAWTIVVAERLHFI
jgi:hypothetical protein